MRDGRGEAVPLLAPGDSGVARLAEEWLRCR
jgi:hypothetical protein